LRVACITDPFGVSPPFNLHNRIVKFNNIKDQELDESNCGWRSLAFIKSFKQ